LNRHLGAGCHPGEAEKLVSGQNRDVIGWLRDLGLERYTQTFRDAEITAGALPALTDADLRELGLPLGPRKLVLKAIRDLAGVPVMEAVAAAARAEAGPRIPSILSEAERRQLTVMFVDLVGSTALSARLDPEEMREVLRAYQNAVAGEVARFEGHVTKYMGDGVLAYFGWPKAHEDEAERAVRAGMAITEAVGRLEAPVRLAARVGIATGLVVVGDLVGEEGRREEVVIGEPPNLAARLQAQARPGAVVLAPSTRRLIGGLFECADLGKRRLQGVAAPVQAWQVLREGWAASRYEALRGPDLVPLVGREREIGLLLDLWERAKGGAGQVVLVSGEPGIGKSRLIMALRERLVGEPHAHLGLYCSPQHRGSPLHPVAAHLRHAAGLDPDDPPDRRLAKLELLLAQAAGEVSVAVSLLAALLEIPTGERYAPLGLSPQRQRERTLEALVGHVEGVAAREPVLLVLEDAHWADPSSLELLGLLIARARPLPALLIVTFRSAFAPPWKHDLHAIPLALDRLDAEQGATLVAKVAGGNALPAEVVREILGRADGVPLFIEELTKAVLEAQMLREEGGRHERDGRLPLLAVPATLHDSLMARLDRVLPAKETAQVAACIGREFDQALLMAVSDLADADLRQALDTLVSAELVFPCGRSLGASYVFKHALVRDAAYASLLRTRRQEIHRRIVTALEAADPPSPPEIVARQASCGGLVEKAVENWLRAGTQATARSAYREAIIHLREGLTLLDQLPSGADRDDWELAFRSALITPLIAAEGYGATELEVSVNRAAVLAERHDDRERLFPVLHGQWVHRVAHAQHHLSVQLANRFLARARATGMSSVLLMGHHDLGISLFVMGDFVRAREHLVQAAGLHDRGEHRLLGLQYGPDPHLGTLAFLALTEWLCGFPGRARATLQAAFAWAEELKQAHNVGYLRFFGGALPAHLRRDRAALERYAYGLREVADAQGLYPWLGYAEVMIGRLLADHGNEAAALGSIARGLQHLERIGQRVYRPYMVGLLAEAQSSLGDTAAAMVTLQQALEQAAAQGERWALAAHQGLLGDLCTRLEQPQPELATRALTSALMTARAQQARSLELRAGTLLARLWAEQGRRTEAHDLLAPIYGWFTEGFDTPDLIEAKKLLDVL
jgi:class 3 adenylate cyclase/predicted ATPase